MNHKEQLQKLATEKNTPCVTISFNTHRTHPDNAKDEVMLKNLLKEAKERVIAEFGKRSVAPLLEKLENVGAAIDHNYNLDSLHLFLSNNTQEIIKSAWKTSSEGVQVADSFSVRSLIKAYNRSQDYLLLLLSQGGVQLYEVLNDGVVGEIRNNDFPFSENRHYITHPDKASDPKQLDNMVREFLNKVDKAVAKVYNQTNLPCVVICTEDNYSKLKQVADKPEIYLGFAPIDYNKTAHHHIATQSWEIIKELQLRRRTEAIAEIKEAIAQGKALADLHDIYLAAIDGRGEMLIVQDDYSQSAIMNDERSFDLTDDVTQHNAIDDITSNIAWEVLCKKGRVFFASLEEMQGLGKIVLKTRF
jgi:hypothetical protein